MSAPPPLPRRLLATALAVLCAALLAPVAHAGVPDAKRPPAGFVGMTSEDAFAATATERRATLAAQGTLGIRTIRQRFDWSEMQPVRGGAIAWNPTDQMALDAARAGIALLPVIFGAPGWASSRPAGNTTHGTYPPADRAAFATFARAVAARYGRGGTLWTEHPEVAPKPIVSYQVWNEPNLAIYWLPKPNAAAYVRLVKATRAALRAVDPAAQIVLGGMPPASHLGTRLTTYLGQMYKAGARGAFDVVAVNNYASSASAFVAALTKIRTAIVKARDRTAGLWVTEFGWGAGGPRGTYNVGEARQASLIRSTIAAMAKARRSLRLQGFVYYGWRDLPPYAGRSDFWGLHTGLHWGDGRPKAAAAAFGAAVRRL